MVIRQADEIGAEIANIKKRVHFSLSRMQYMSVDAIEAIGASIERIEQILQDEQHANGCAD